MVGMERIMDEVNIGVWRVGPQGSPHGGFTGGVLILPPPPAGCTPSPPTPAGYIPRPPPSTPLPGTRGLTGSNGNTGPRGDSGPSGRTGATGTEGPSGPSGGS